MADPLSSVTGLSSGVDWKGLVDQIIKLDRRPADRMQASVDANTARREALASFQATLRKLQTAGDALRFGGAFAKFTASAAGTDLAGRAVLAAAPSAGAMPGAYTVDVAQLAQTQKNAGSVGFASATAPLGLAGGLVVGGERVDVGADDSLAAVRDKINAVQARSGVRATLVAGRADGSDQRLVLTAVRSGSAGAFTVADPDDAALAAALGIAVATRPAQDARLTVDGVTVTRPTNVVGDAIPGVTLTLGAPGTSQLAIEREPAAAPDAVKAFVDAYNEVHKSIAAQQTMGADGTRPPLRGEPLMRTLRTGLSSAVTGSSALAKADGTPTGVPSELATFAAMGVSLQKDGTLTFDPAKFEGAYQGRFDELRVALGARAQAVATVVGAAVNPLSGAIDTRGRALGDENARLADRIADVDARLDKRRQSLLAQYARFEAALGRMKAVGDSLTAQFSGLNASRDK
jgi:flagellar hook-associated protein 2